MNVCWCSCISVGSCHRAGGDFGCSTSSVVNLAVLPWSAAHHRYICNLLLFASHAVSFTSSPSAPLLPDRRLPPSCSDQSCPVLKTNERRAHWRLFSVSELWFNSNGVECHCLSFILVLSVATLRFPSWTNEQTLIDGLDAQRDSRLVPPLPGGPLTPSCCPPGAIHSQSLQRPLK